MAKKEAAAGGGAVTFRALLSPKQGFTFNGAAYQFHEWKFVTGDAALIEFLDANQYCERVV
jgi:hypothetical protein